MMIDQPRPKLAPKNVIGKATKETEAQNSPLDVEGAAELFEAMEKYNQELLDAGIVLAGDGLKPSKLGKRIHISGAKRTVTDGPFTETKELVAGYSIWQVRSIEEAVEWVKRSPVLGPSVVEIRPLWEPEDFDPEIVALVKRGNADA